MLLAAAGCQPETGAGRPAVVDRLIAQQQAEERRNPPGSVWQYRYGDRVVFYVPPACCDIPGELYDSDGKLLCLPDGGITGNGDGRCPDFFEVRTDERHIWTDDR